MVAARRVHRRDRQGGGGAQGDGEVQGAVGAHREMVGGVAVGGEDRRRGGGGGALEEKLFAAAAFV